MFQRRSVYVALCCRYSLAPLTASCWSQSPALTPCRGMHSAACSPYGSFRTTCGSAMVATDFVHVPLHTSTRQGSSVTRAHAARGVSKQKKRAHGTRAAPAPRRSSPVKINSTSLRQAEQETAQDEEDLLEDADEEDVAGVDGDDEALLQDSSSWGQHATARSRGGQGGDDDEEDDLSADTLTTDEVQPTGRHKRRKERKSPTATAEDGEEEDGEGAGNPNSQDAAAAAAVDSKYLVDVQPELSAEYVAAGKANTQDVKTLKVDSGAVVSWRCATCHGVWKSAIFLRCILKNGCPSCEAKKHPSIAEARPDLVPLWHPNLNDPLDSPATLPADSRKPALWLCGVCRRDYRARIKDRVKDKAPCPWCASDEREERHDGDDSRQRIEALLEQEWHPLKNGDLRLDTLKSTQQQQTKVWWLCSRCSHAWTASVAARRSPHKRSKGRVCPKCRGVGVGATAATQSHVDTASSSVFV